MEKKLLYVIICVATIIASSCKSLEIIPNATNSAGAVSFYDLRLERSEYLILNTVTEIATVVYDLKDNKIQEKNGEFRYTFEYDKKSRQIKYNDIEGVVMLGSLNNVASNVFDPTNAADIAKRLAIFRLNNSAAEAGADFVIEPLVSMSIKQTGKNEVTYTATATAKLVKIKKVDD